MRENTVRKPVESRLGVVNEVNSGKLSVESGVDGKTNVKRIIFRRP